MPSYKGLARRNPFASDPSIAEPPDGNWVLDPDYQEFTGGRQVLDGFIVTELPDGMYRIVVMTVLPGISAWRSYGWSTFMPASVGLFAGDAIFVRTPLGEGFYLKRTGNVLRIYRVFEQIRKNPLVQDPTLTRTPPIAKRKARRNPLVQDPSYVGAPRMNLKVVKLLVDYDYRKETGISSYPCCEITRAHRVSFRGNALMWIWDISSQEWKPLGDKSVYMYPDRTAFVLTSSGDAMILQRGETLRIYELGGVRS